MSGSPAVVAALAGTELFAGLSPDLLDLLAAAVQPVGHSFGSVVVRAGDPADALYVVTEGRARVLVEGEGGVEVPLGVLAAGDVFGEIGLLHGGTRSATVRASTPLQLLRLDGPVVAALVTSRPELREHLDGRTALLRTRDALRTDTRLRALPASLLTRLAAGATRLEPAAGTRLTVDGLLVLRSGRWRLRDGTGRVAAYPGAGDLVGVAACTGAGLDATVRAGAGTGAWTAEVVRDSVGWQLPPDAAGLLTGDPAGLELLDRVRRRETEGEVLEPLDVDRETGATVGGSVEEPPLGGVADPDAAAAPPDDARWRRGRRVRRMPLVRQVDEADCGAACLAMLMRHAGHPVRLHRIRAAVGTAVDGTSLRGLVQGAETLGLEARAVKLSRSALDEVVLPAVCHRDGNHWVVVHDTDRDTVRFADPGVGLRRESKADFTARWSGYAVLAVPRPDLRAAPREPGAAAALLPLLRRYARPLAGAGGLALLLAALQLALPVALGLLVDRALPRRDAGLLWLLLGGLAALLVLGAAAAGAQRWLVARTAVRLDADALDLVAGRLLSLPLSWFVSRRTGDVQRRLTGLRLVREFAVQNGLVALAAVAQVLVALALLGAYSPLLLGAYVLVAPAYAGLLVAARRRLRPLYEETEEALGRHASLQVEAVKGIESVKVLGAEDRLLRQLRTEFAALSGRLYRADLGGLLFDGAVQLVAATSLLLVLAAAAQQVLVGALSVGDLVAVNGLLVLATTPLALLLQLWDQVQQYGVVLTRLDDVVGEPAEQEGLTGLRTVPGLGGRVDLVGVGFSYGAGVPPVLEDVTLSIEPGETVALVGRSGSGKSTLLKLLTGLLEPTSGVVRYDGVDLAGLEHGSLRRHLGVVLQETFLFGDTIARNIAFTDEVPDMERVRWAAAVADAEDFIGRLPMGYQTRVGESGLRLSGGQQQRVAIARAVYRRPGVLLLDEATSALDAESERAVQEGLARLLAGRTAIVIAHRLSTVRDADRIVVLERGRVVEQGTHDQLVRLQGLYAHLCSRQLDV